MGWRYRKRIKILPGIHINISKSGISTNVGVKGASVTFGPKGTYVNTGLPGTGVYRRDRISGSAKKYESTNETDDERYAFSNNFHSIEEYTEDTSFLSYNPLHYIFYFFSLIFPIAAFAWYINGLDMLYSCLINTGFQLILCYAIITNMSLNVENSAYRIKLIEKASSNSIKREIVGHVVRCSLYIIIIFLNLFPILSMSGSFVRIFCGYEKSWDGGVLVFLLTLLIVICWVKAFIKEKKYIISLDNAVLLKQGIRGTKEGISSCPNDNIEEQIIKSEPIMFSNEEELSSPNLNYPLSRDILGNLKNKEQGKSLSSLTTQELKEMLENQLKSDNKLSSSVVSRQVVRDILGILVNNDNANSSATAIKQNKERVSQPCEELLEPYDPKRDLESYYYPKLDLLKKYDDGGKPFIDMKEQQANKNRIVDTLRSFGIEISTIKATVGPRVTLYEITLAPGVNASKLRGLEDDIALALSSHNVQILIPIPGKGTIGIEVPNKHPSIVSLESLINTKKYQETTMELPCAIGKTITNEVFMFDLTKAPHILIAGSTGQGKSIALNTMIMSLLYKKHPAEMKLVLMDPYGVEFGMYAQIAKQFLASLSNEPVIVSNSGQAISTLNSLCKEMEARYNLLKMASVRNIQEYNKKFVNRQLNSGIGHRFIPYIVVVIDEYGDFIEEKGQDFESSIVQLAQYACAVGIHMIISTKRPTNDIITGAIKANFPTRIAFRLPERIDSQVILDCDGAEELLGNGDLLFRAGKSIDCIRVQCAFVDTPEVECINEYISSQEGYTSFYELPDPYHEEEYYVDDVDMAHLDPLFEDAARLIVMTQKGSTGLIQRKFAIGYNRAGRLMDQLEKAGIVGAAYGSRPREVFIMDEMGLNNLLNSLR
jgi:S-DNA-T family DNA segregation ATPase FtsK/SpoIIIE